MAGSAQIRMLGVVRPGRLTDTSLFAPTAGYSAVISSVVVCNTEPTPEQFRIGITTADNPSNALYWNVTIGPNETFVATIGITLSATAGDSLYVYDTVGNLTFTVFGQETPEVTV